MKTTNSKGKLFGILNIVDICIIVFLVVVACGAYMFLNTTIQANKTTKTYTATLEMQGVEEDFCKAIKTDRKVFDRIKNEPFGTLTEVSYEPRVEYTVSSIDGSSIKTEVPGRYDARVELELTTDTQLYVGKFLSIGTKDFTGSGYIIKLEEVKK